MSSRDVFLTFLDYATLHQWDVECLDLASAQGTFTGYSALCFAHAGSCLVVSIERCSLQAAAAREFFSALPPGLPGRLRGLQKMHGTENYPLGTGISANHWFA